MSYTLSQPKEFAIGGDPDDVDTQALLAVAQDCHWSFQVLAPRAPNTQPPVVPLLRDQGLVAGQAAAYVCRSFACYAPVTDAQALRMRPGPRVPPLPVLCAYRTA
jgi:uncharacterized protein YyaL (SSP411 family)